MVRRCGILGLYEISSPAVETAVSVLLARNSDNARPSAISWWYRVELDVSMARYPNRRAVNTSGGALPSLLAVPSHR